MKEDEDHLKELEDHRTLQHQCNFRQMSKKNKRIRQLKESLKMKSLEYPEFDPIKMGVLCGGVNLNSQ